MVATPVVVSTLLDVRLGVNYERLPCPRLRTPAVLFRPFAITCTESSSIDDPVA